MQAIRVPAEALFAATAQLADIDRREMAVPSYTHWNPLIRWLFWKRLDTSIQLAQVERSEAIFEFAAGTGVLLPTHHAVAGRVACTDLHPGPSMALAEMYGTKTEHVPLEGLASWAAANRSAFGVRTCRLGPCAASSSPSWIHDRALRLAEPVIRWVPREPAQGTGRIPV